MNDRHRQPIAAKRHRAAARPRSRQPGPAPATPAPAPAATPPDWPARGDLIYWAGPAERASWPWPRA